MNEVLYEISNLYSYIMQNDCTVQCNPGIILQSFIYCTVRRVYAKRVICRAFFFLSETSPYVEVPCARKKYSRHFYYYVIRVLLAKVSCRILTITLCSSMAIFYGCLYIDHSWTIGSLKYKCKTQSNVEVGSKSCIKDTSTMRLCYVTNHYNNTITNIRIAKASIHSVVTHVSFGKKYGDWCLSKAYSVVLCNSLSTRVHSNVHTVSARLRACLDLYLQHHWWEMSDY